MKIRTRAYLLGLLPALLVAILLGSYLGLSRTDDLETALRERGSALARHIAQGAEYAVVSGNPAPLDPLLTGATRERDVIAIGVYQPNGERIAAAGRKPAALRAPLRAGVANVGETMVFTVPVEFMPIALDDPFFQSQAPPQAAPRVIAWVQVVISRAGNTAVARQQILATLGIVAVAMLFTVMLVRGLVLGGIRPLMEIIAAVRGIARHNFRIRLPTTAKSELQELQKGINLMGEALLSFEEDMQGSIDAATAEMARQKEAAERADQAKSTFLAAASHDLRQPMHAISLYVASMRPQVAGRDAATTLGKLEDAVAVMENLFCGILDISKLDAGSVVPEITGLSVRSLLEGLYADFHHEAEAKGLRLRLRHCEATVVSDPVLLRRILRNLIANALRYTERGGILIAARRHGGAIRFQVWDSGQGIQPEHIDHIFHAYFQAANPQRDRTQGLGLGLAIVDRLAQLLGHPLAVHSRPGRGTVFSIDVPINLANVASEDAARKTLADIAQLHGLVAIVDDDAMVLDSMQTLLQGWGLGVVKAGGIQDLLRGLERAPDLLITDYRLGAEDGLKSAKILRDAYPDAVFSVVIVTGDVSEESMRDLSSAGYPILHKPVLPARLRALVTHLLLSQE
ncbi:MAG: hypothetical protein B7X94_00140 [Hydrogenophilales bacterium 17-62-8]|nr:MAG: hypothetical protein B7X94_00140 [Hydrogenophilales bacterium 17-62-8]